MKNKDLKEEQRIANQLRQEVLTAAQTSVRSKTKTNLKELEMISEVQKPYVSPIMTMNEDEILAFVEEFEVAELATLSVAELNRIGEVLGVDPSILAEVEED